MALFSRDFGRRGASFVEYMVLVALAVGAVVMGAVGLGGAMRTGSRTQGHLIVAVSGAEIVAAAKMIPGGAEGNAASGGPVDVAPRAPGELVCDPIRGCTAPVQAPKAAPPKPAGPPPPRELSGSEAVALMKQVLEESRVAYIAKYPDRLGRGWSGNVTGSGDKCNVVHDRFAAMVEQRYRAALRQKNVVVTTHDLTTRVASGTLFVEALSGHVYIAMVDLRGKTPKDVLVFDPWRSKSAFFTKDPNWGSKEDVRWLMNRMLPPRE